MRRTGPRYVPKRVIWWGVDATEDPLRFNTHRIRPILMASAIACGLLVLPETAAAQSHGATFGITIPFSWGIRRAWGFGFDWRYSYYIPTNEYPVLEQHYLQNHDYASTGAFIQLTFLRGGAVRVAAGAHGGYLPAVRMLGIDGEVGITYRSRSKVGKEPAGVGLHLGVFPTLSLLLVEHGPSIRGAIGFSKKMGNEFILGWDVRAPGPCAFIECVSYN
jgi:hypothetical protein